MRSLPGASRILAALLATTLTTACSDQSTTPARDPQVSLSFTAPASALAASAGSAAVVEDAAGRTLELERVQLLVAEVELKRLQHDDCAEDDDVCEKFRSGPKLVDLPLDGGVVTPFADPVPPAVYHELELEIDRPEDDDGARARFAAEHPEWPGRATVRATGTFDAGTGDGPQPFDLFLEIDSEIVHEFATPLVVDEATDPASINLTVAVDVAEWFRGPDGELLDPRELTPDSELVKQVQERLERSFEAFEDSDRDGHHDGRDDGDRSGNDDEESHS